MSKIGICLFIYSILESKFYFGYKRSIKRCQDRLTDANDNYSVPNDVALDLIHQVKSMPNARTFLRDIFHVEHHSEIKKGNLENLLKFTLGAAKPLILNMIEFLENKLDYEFENGYNESLQHTYCREDNIVRSVYIPAIFKSPLVSLKFSLDFILRFDYERISKDNMVYWIRNKDNINNNIELSVKKKVLIFMCGIGIGPIIYYYYLKNFYEIYETIIICEIKWISFHLNAEPVQDSILISDIFDYLNSYLSNLKNYSTPDLMAHSGGALYFRRLLDKMKFNNQILIEPACFLSGSSTATKQIYTYKTYNPLFQHPLIKNLPKLCDIAESVLLTDTKLENVVCILSENDSLFNPIPIMEFMHNFHPHVKVFTIENSSHGDAISKNRDITTKIILKQFGYL